MFGGYASAVNVATGAGRTRASPHEDLVEGGVQRRWEAVSSDYTDACGELTRPLSGGGVGPESRRP